MPKHSLNLVKISSPGIILLNSSWFHFIQSTFTMKFFVGEIRINIYVAWNLHSQFNGVTYYLFCTSHDFRIKTHSILTAKTNGRDRMLVRVRLNSTGDYFLLIRNECACALYESSQCGLCAVHSSDPYTAKLIEPTFEMLFHILRICSLRLQWKLIFNLPWLVATIYALLKTYIVQLEIEATSIADCISILVPPPKSCHVGAAVGTSRTCPSCRWLKRWTFWMSRRVNIIQSF